MLNSIDGRWIDIIAPGFFFLEDTVGPFPLGTNVYASIALSQVNTLFSGNDPDPTFAVEGFVISWTFYNPDGTESAPQGGVSFTQNAIAIQNCATITFALAGERVAAIAQINVITF